MLLLGSGERRMGEQMGKERQPGLEPYGIGIVMGGNCTFFLVDEYIDMPPIYTHVHAPLRRKWTPVLLRIL